ncbi:MAG: HypC/HybG/HupF family hydrogenase formation chaperone [Anaeromusa sp.]|uniref:HypC/HybG/HupF family hydrogenase formation chaperone n=1 Tax=Anaeromusa sp. TaxID=1872520 RepID=UPI002B213F27|nr:HypC/HybG/HupF family hydrogenase formation chaperone [Anaeromusa sp.]MEA4836059.1 HypC/HybG/HupF family hydrogenase formation chaperone [Anaeromusa sp.]NCB77925.1 HypC/HybG/HupF family hydrogenase formation chaperone [Negativicutes bacterium]
MCLAVPAQIVEREDMLATVDVGGVQRQVSMLLLPEAQIGDYVLIHAGFAMQQIDEEEAKLTWSLLQEMAEHVQDA